MTEPDEALLWAREQAKQLREAPNDPTRDLSAEIDVGMHDDELSDMAHGYRAGAAASAERIKALEEGLSMLYDLFTHVKPSAFRNGVTDSTNTIDEGEVQAGLILDRAKALLKEPDEPTDEPTAEDAYGWGCQGWGDPR